MFRLFSNSLISLFFFFFFFFFIILSWPPCIPARKTLGFALDNHVVTVKSYNSTWYKSNIESFLNGSIGSQVIDISEIKKHLHRFGYFQLQNDTFTDNTLDARFESAVTLYQEKLGLPISGKLDFATVSQIFTPRCGMPDTTTIPIHTLHGTKHYVFFPGKPRWSRRMPMKLTYAFSQDYMIHNLTLSEIRVAFKRAFRRWASVIPVSFTETDDYSFADIKIGFYNGDHGDGEPFDGVLGILAHSFSPESGRFHLDAAETWAVDFRKEKSAVAIDLESVATHEIGHLLGLAHSPVKEAVMYPSLKPRDQKLDLTLDDIEGVQALYGSNPNFRFGSLLESDTSTNQAVSLRNIRSYNVWVTLFLKLVLILCLCM